MKQNLRLLIADDHLMLMNVFVKGISMQYPYVTFVGSTTQANQVITLIEQHNPDGIFLDLRFNQDLDGLDLIRQIRSRNLSIKIIVLSQFTENSIIKEAISLGANGYLTKSDTLEAIGDALEVVFEKDGIYLSHEISKDFILSSVSERQNKNKSVEFTVLDKLTDRELDVFLLLAKGKNPEDIQASLELSYATYITTVRQINKKTGFSNFSQYTIYAIKHKLINMD